MMPESVWPGHHKLEMRSLVLTLRFFAALRNLRSVATVAAILLLYVIGLHTPLPTVHAASIIDKNTWWFIRLFDHICTGGALGRGALFSLGLLSLLTLGGNVRIERGRLLNYMSYCCVTATIVIVFYISGFIQGQFVVLAKTFGLLAFGGIAVVFLNRMLIMRHGPHILHVNVFQLLAVEVSAVIAKLAKAERWEEISLLLGVLVFVGLSVLFVLRRRTCVQILSVKAQGNARQALLDFRTVNEFMMDTIGLFAMAAFICGAGLISLLADWTNVEHDHFWLFSIVGGIVLAITFLFFATLRHILTSAESPLEPLWQTFNIYEILSFHNPLRYAERMIRGHWVVPGVRAGVETCRYLGKRTSYCLYVIFGWLSCWLCLIVIVQYYVYARGSGLTLFPFGALVFLFLYLTCIGYVSMLSRHIGTCLSHYQQIARGKMRVLQQVSYSVPRLRQLRQFEIGEQEPEYWEEERFDEQIREIRRLLYLFKESGTPIAAPKLSRKSRVVEVTYYLLASVSTGLFLSFLGGVPYKLLKPDGDIYAVVIPLFVGGFFTPQLMSEWLKKHPVRKED